MGWLSKSWDINKGIFGGGYLRDLLGSDKILGEGSGRLRGEQQGLINQERESDLLYGAQTQDQLEKALTARVGGYNQAIEKTSDISRSARREVVDRAKATEGMLTSRLGAGGKFGTTALENAKLGLQSTMSRDLESIDSAFSGLFAELATGRGEAEAAGRGALGAFSQQRSAQASELFRLLSGTLKPEQQGMLSDILGLLGAGVGTSIGGKFGGAIGGEAGSQLGGLFERT